MFKFPKSKISWKLFCAFLSVTLCSLFFLYVHLSASLSVFLSEHVEEDLLEKAYLIRDRLQNVPVQNWTFDILDPLADRMGSETHTRVTLIDRAGRVLGDSELSATDLKTLENHLQRPEVQSALQVEHGSAVRYSATLGTNMMYVAVRMDQGFVRVAIPMHVLDQTLFGLDHAVLLSSLLAFLLASAVGILFSRMLTKPLKLVSEVAQRIARGDFSKRILLSSHDELGDLADSVNRMATSLKKLFNEIDNEKKRLMTILNDMVEGVLVTDEYGHIVLANPAVRTMLLLSESCLGKTVLECVRNKNIHDAIFSVRTMARSCEEEIALESGGVWKHLILHAAPLVDVPGGGGVVSVFYDVTRLRELENVRKEFVANVSHELKTPLTNILGYSETLKSAMDLDAPTMKNFIGKIERNAMVLKNLVDDILEISTLESGRRELHPEAVALADHLSHIGSFFEPRLADKHICFEIESPDDLIVFVDPIVLRQILTNLVDNAIKYNIDGGALKIKVQRDGKYCVVTVSDTGAGIPERDLEHVFERFYRVEKSRSRELGGSGLGLSIVKHLTQASGGDVSVTSRAGEGSTFSFTLPLV